MEIQKIYSEFGDWEKIYKVLMTEEEVMLFSETRKEFVKSVKKALQKAPVKKMGIFNGEAAKLSEAEYAKKYLKSYSDSELEEAGKVGIGLGMGAGLVAGGAKLYQGNQVGKAMKVGKVAPGLTHKEVMNRVDNFIKNYKPGTYYHDTTLNNKARKHINKAIRSSQISRIAGRGALIAGGLGALAYGASKLGDN